MSSTYTCLSYLSFTWPEGYVPWYAPHVTCDMWCTLTTHIRKIKTPLLLSTHGRAVGVSVFRCQERWFGFPYNCPMFAVKWTKTKILATHVWEKRVGRGVSCEEVREMGNDQLVDTLPFASLTLQGTLPNVAHFSYFPAASGLPSPVAINHRHATLHLFKKAFQTVQTCEDKIQFPAFAR